MFGEFAVNHGYIDAQGLERVLTIARFHKQKIGRLMVALNYFNKGILDHLLYSYLKPICTLRYDEILEMKDRLKIDLKEEEFLHAKNLVVIKLDEEQITVLGNHFSDDLIQVLEAKFSLKINLLVIETKALKLLLAKRQLGPTSAQINVSMNQSDDEKLLDPSPFVQLIKECLVQATIGKASDIHFEPYEQNLFVRFRIHGHLSDHKVLAGSYCEPLISKLKWLLNMDLATVYAPQDSRATFRSLGVDIRASSMPTIAGSEKIVLRLQYQNQKFDIHALGLPQEKLDVLLNSIQKSDGLVLISGPTGSGKTTTIYALLEEMDRLGKNISTLENPVEKKLDRVNQARLSDFRDFEDFQRALMRQDPDVILLGEIRDAETADLSMKLASTGHLVLSTIHANGALEVIDRLMNLGVDRYTIQTNLRLSVAQRLVRILCEHCSLDVASKQLVKAPDHLTGKYRLLNPLGCHHCFKGVSGRAALIEYIERSELGKVGTPDFKIPNSLACEYLRLAQSGRIDAHEAFSVI